jgi:phosphoribosylanthranilate isomerase
VGVFVDEPADRVKDVAALVGLDIAQLHGSESPALVRSLSGVVRVIKAVGLQNGEPPNLTDLDDDVVILLDAHDSERHGGTGRTIDWDAARKVASSHRTILSGGLSAENVSRAVAAVQPYGVDVSSGVECAPGVKDPARLKSFFEALNG